ncbi:uncharacterized protein LOC134270772, partial [Saccostrea cucullata]|uniref:uncharacterized protein LOC134270772 n=1 Tax=Saccostrea cuccullata TaxID=36930 RepID=UPI002ECFED88
TNWIPSYSKHENGNPYHAYGDAYFYDTEKVPPTLDPPPYGEVPNGGHSTASDTNALTEAQKAKRNRHTIGFIFFGILLIGAAAAATALIIHYVFITEHERITDHKLNLINNTTRADLIEENIDNISIDDLGKIGTKLTTVSPSKDGSGSNVKIDVSEPETFSVPVSTKSPIKTDDGTTESSPLTTVTAAPKKVEFPDYTYEIGLPGKLRCRINRVRMWDAITINGTKDVVGQNTPLSFKLLSSNETCLEGNDSRITTEFDIKRTRSASAKYDDIEMTVHLSEIKCEDMGDYECWVDGPTVYKVTNSVTVKRYPKSRPTLKIPYAIIENEPISIKGFWNSGFPDSYGELEWYILKPGADEHPWTDVKNTVNTKNCDNEAASIINLPITLEMNQTKIKLQPYFYPQFSKEKQRRKIEHVTEEILVVPANFCEGKKKDKNIIHPYTCKLFIICTDRINIYECPKETTCFDEAKGTCE